MNAADAWKLACGNLSNSESWWEKVIQAYQEPCRHYHNVAFLDRKFKLLDELGTASDMNAVILAIIFQYYEYDPQDRASTNNLAHFQEFASTNDLPQGLRSKVEALLTGNEDDLEKNANGENDVQLLQDLDMSFLGLVSDAFLDIIKLERKEYDFMSDEAYNAMRRKALQTFLLIPNIFLTNVCRDRFEAQARANIEAEVQSLGK
ncbi:uncharacterized protein LOC132194166 [Neocloeon triangulifer]|uniref:uncharacterized protein LOC132194166 n=1 Tax=Neocloeon triangulifer TaxID=2078957 RepID=UPI00286F07AE|nr:uncharacterized protein LOC132194166 [Neocloeon triangulifer]